MKMRSLFAALAVGLTMLQAQGAGGAEIKVLSIPFKGPLDEIRSEFERTTAHKLLIRYAPRAGLGVAVKKGAAKPDITSTDAFKRVLLNASSIAYAAEGPSGIHLIGLIERLGIAAQTKPKLKPMGAGSLVVAPVAKGEVEVGVVGIPFILAEPGVELVGPLPAQPRPLSPFSRTRDQCR